MVLHYFINNTIWTLFYLFEFIVGMQKALYNSLRVMHPDDTELGLSAGSKYSRWKASESLKEVFEGTNTYTPWNCGAYVSLI